MLQKRATPKDGPFPLDQLRDFRDAASVRSAPRLRNSSAITVYSPKESPILGGTISDVSGCLVLVLVIMVWSPAVT